MVKPDYQQKYFDEKFSNLEDGLGEIKHIMRQTADAANSAHKRIDAWENKIWGLTLGSSGLGGFIVYLAQHVFK